MKSSGEVLQRHAEIDRRHGVGIVGAEARSPAPARTAAGRRWRARRRGGRSRGAWQLGLMSSGPRASRARHGIMSARRSARGPDSAMTCDITHPAAARHRPPSRATPPAPRGQGSRGSRATLAVATSSMLPSQKADAVERAVALVGDVDDAALLGMVGVGPRGEQGDLLRPQRQPGAAALDRQDVGDADEVGDEARARAARRPRAACRPGRCGRRP